jgi:hypothetical protein
MLLPPTPQTLFLPLLPSSPKSDPVCGSPIPLAMAALRSAVASLQRAAASDDSLPGAAGNIDGTPQQFLKSPSWPVGTEPSQVGVPHGGTIKGGTGVGRGRMQPHAEELRTFLRDELEIQFWTRRSTGLLRSRVLMGFTARTPCGAGEIGTRVELIGWSPVSFLAPQHVHNLVRLVALR